MKATTQHTAQLEQVAAFSQILQSIGIEPKALFQKKEVCKITGVSAATLDRMAVQGIGMNTKKIGANGGGGKNGRVLYPIGELARFYFDTIKTA